MSYIISALRTETQVNCGDHAQDITTAVEVAPGETVEHLVERLLTREVYQYPQPGDETPQPREGRYGDFVVLRIAQPVEAAPNA